MNNAEHVQQVPVNPITVLSAVVNALGAMTITVANKANSTAFNLGDIFVYGTSAAARITKAVDQRSEIYGNAIVSNGELAEREHAVKSRMRLANLEAQEAEQLAQTKPARKTRGPNKSKTTKAKTPKTPKITRNK